MHSRSAFRPVFTKWQFASVVTAGTILAAALYLWGVIRVARSTRPPGEGFDKLCCLTSYGDEGSSLRGGSR
jgi:hypothetical protein